MAIDGVTVQTEEVNSMAMRRVQPRRRLDLSSPPPFAISSYSQNLSLAGGHHSVYIQSSLKQQPELESTSETHKSLATTGSWFKHFLPLENQEIGLSHCVDTRETIT